MGEKGRKSEDNDDLEIYENSKLHMASYQMNQFLGQWFTGPFGFFVFLFYEVTIGLSVWLVALGFIIYAVWNAINDPLVGYLLGRAHMPWEEKWGKRFPWVMIGVIPWLFTFLLIFSLPSNLDPSKDQWIIFLWLLISICAFDTLFTLWTVNTLSMFPDKFPKSKERMTASGIGALVGMAGIVSSSLIPPLLIDQTNQASFIFASWVIIGVAFIIIVLMIPGVRENKRTRERYKQRAEKEKELQQKSFFEASKDVIKNKRFTTKVIFFFGYQAAVALLQASALYMVIYVMDADSFYLSILLGAMLLGAIISTPLWIHLGHRFNDNRKLSIIAGFAMFFGFIPMFFVFDLVFFIIVLLLFGITLGGQWLVDPPTMADVLDDVAVQTGRRQEEIHYGYQTFFVRFGQVVQAVSFALVHILTGFVEGAQTRDQLFARSPTPELALLGIRIHTALIPAVLVLVCTLLFWKFYDLTPDVIAENKKKLKELDLR